MKTEEEVQAIIDQFEELQKMAAPIATQLIRLENPKTRETICSDEITVEDGLLCANWETYCCGDIDYHQTVIPISYLFDEDWQEYAKAEIERKNEEERKWKEQQRLAAEQRHREAEHKRYLELKAKYEGNN